jgi:hypothetical protein
MLSLQKVSGKQTCASNRLTGSSIRFQNGLGVCSQAPISLIYKSADTCPRYRFAWELIFFFLYLCYPYDNQKNTSSSSPSCSWASLGWLACAKRRDWYGYPHPSARLHISDNARGLLIPNVALTATNVAAPVTSPATSLLVYNTNTAGTGATAVTPGFYYWDGSQWVRLADGGKAWLLTGNAGTDPATNFLGTTDAQPLCIRVNNQETFRFNPPSASAPAWSIQRGGNPRGLHAVDLQSARSAATQVASGDYSVIGGAFTNTASGLAATVGGGGLNTASGLAASNTASGGYATVGGGFEQHRQRLPCCHRWRGLTEHRQRRWCHRWRGLSTTPPAALCHRWRGLTTPPAAIMPPLAGARDNTASGYMPPLAGAIENTASGEYATVGGGYINTASGDFATVGGGARTPPAAIMPPLARATPPAAWLPPLAGARQHRHATVGGGRQNTASDQFARWRGLSAPTGCHRWRGLGQHRQRRVCHRWRGLPCQHRQRELLRCARWVQQYCKC